MSTTIAQQSTTVAQQSATIAQQIAQLQSADATQITNTNTLSGQVQDIQTRLTATAATVATLTPAQVNISLGQGQDTSDVSDCHRIVNTGMFCFKIDDPAAVKQCLLKSDTLPGFRRRMRSVACLQTTASTSGVMQRLFDALADAWLKTTSTPGVMRGPPA